MSFTPPPSNPIFISKYSFKTAFHCPIKSIVGTCIKVGRPILAISITASIVLPAPVGSVTTPRYSEIPASAASVWNERGVIFFLRGNVKAENLRALSK